MNCSELYSYLSMRDIHPVLSTILPKDNEWLVEFLNNWIDIMEEKEYKHHVHY